MTSTAVWTTVLALLCLLPAYAAATDQLHTEPLLRIEAGGHVGSILSVASDTSGRFLVTASYDRTARVWDAATGRLLRVLRVPIGADEQGKLVAVAMAPDGSRVACARITKVAGASHSIYVFDRATGRLIRRIGGMSERIRRLAWSANGRLLAAVLTDGHGLRLIRVADGQIVGTDSAYDGHASSVDFSRSGRLVSTSYDGKIRLYRTDNELLSLIATRDAPGGKQPWGARFSPDGTKISLGYFDSRSVDVVSGDDLAPLYAPSADGIDNGYLLATAWSADGRRLYAGGQYGVPGLRKIRVWEEAGRGGFTDWSADRSTVLDLVPLKAGGIAFGSFSGAWGALNASGGWTVAPRHAVAEVWRPLRFFAISPDATVARFATEELGQAPVRFDVASRQLDLGPIPEGQFSAPLTRAPGLDIRDWSFNNRHNQPTLNGVPLPLDPFELSRALAILGDRASFILAADRRIRRFDRTGSVMWSIPVPATPVAVAIAGDDRLFATHFIDGTTRWYRVSDGKETLALFLHADRRWVLWSPSGFYDAAPGAEDLIGWHVNRSTDLPADFYPASRFRGTFYRPDVVSRVLTSVDDTEALQRANQDAGRKTPSLDVASALPPVVDIVAPTSGASVTTTTVALRYSVRTAADAPVLAVRARVNGQPAKLSGARTVGTAETGGELREVSIALPPDSAEVMLFAENRHGVSVPGIVRIVRSSPASPAAATPQTPEFTVKPKLYVLAIGVGDYRPAIGKLRYAAKDARDFAQVVGAQKGALYRDVAVKLLTDATATRDDVVDGLDWLPKQVTAKDVGMLFLAGHGVNDPNGVYYFLPSNADPDRLRRTGVPFSEIRNTLSALAGKALFFVDTCHSGNVMVTAARSRPTSRPFSTSSRAPKTVSGSSRPARDGSTRWKARTGATVPSRKPWSKGCKAELTSTRPAGSRTRCSISTSPSG